MVNRNYSYSILIKYSLDFVAAPFTDKKEDMESR